MVRASEQAGLASRSLPMWPSAPRWSPWLNGVGTGIKQGWFTPDTQLHALNSTFLSQSYAKAVLALLTESTSQFHFEVLCRYVQQRPHLQKCEP